MKYLWFVVLVALAAACSKETRSKPVDAKVWREKNKVALDAWQAKLATIVTLTKDLPAESVHKADPEPPFQVFLASYADVPNPDEVSKIENALFIAGHEVRGYPEYGKYRGVAIDSGDGDISINYMSSYDWAELDQLLDGTSPKDLSEAAADYLVEKLGKVRYLIVAREVEYKRGTIDVAAKTFEPGTFQGVAHLIDLRGAAPTYLGSVAYRAQNTGGFESYSGSEKFMLQMDLEHEAMRAFFAEWTKTFPTAKLSNPPKPDKK